jgi:hypothetical protein
VLIRGTPKSERALHDGAGNGLRDADFVNRAQRRGAHLEGDPLACFGHVKLLGLQVRMELALGLAVGVADVITGDRVFSGEVANL